MAEVSDLEEPSLKSSTSSSVKICSIYEETEFYPALDDSQLNEIYNLNELTELECYLARLLNHKDNDWEMLPSIKLDLLVTAVWCTKDEAYSLEQFTMFYQIFNRQVSNIAIRRMEKKDCLCDLKDHIEEILETSQSDSTIADFIASVTSFLMCSFYRPFELYDYVFSTEQCLLETFDTLVVQIPREIPPLSEATMVENGEEEEEEEEEEKKEIMKEEKEITSQKKKSEEVSPPKLQIVEPPKAVDLVAQMPVDELVHVVSCVFEQMTFGVENELVCMLEKKKLQLMDRLKKSQNPI